MSTSAKREVTEADAIEALISSATAKQKQRGYNNNRFSNRNSNNRNDPATSVNRDNFKRQKFNKDQPSDSALDYYSRPSERNTSSTNTSKSTSNTRWGKQEELEKDDKAEQEPKALPNFALSGALSKDAMNNNTESVVYNGIKLKFSEPADAKNPKNSKTEWRLYVFKPSKDKKDDAELLEELLISKQSAYLFGREKAVADILVEHSSLSRQHCVLQYRSVPTKDSDRTNKSRLIKPYLMDLESGNGTFINGNKLEPARYYELKNKDIITLGFSTREYVLMA